MSRKGIELMGFIHGLCLVRVCQVGKPRLKRLTMTQFGLTPKPRLFSTNRHEILDREVQLVQA